MQRKLPVRFGGGWAETDGRIPHGAALPPYATHKAKNGVSPFKLKDWLGHANLNTTQIYVHMAEENTHRLMEQTSL